MVDRDLDAVSIEGEVDAVRGMLAALPLPQESATATAA